MGGLYVKGSDAGRPSGASVVTNAADTKETYCTNCKEWFLKIAAVILTLGAIFAFLNAANIVFDPTVLHNSIVGYTAGSAAAALVLAIGVRHYFYNPKAAAPAV